MIFRRSLMLVSSLSAFLYASDMCAVGLRLDVWIKSCALKESQVP